jgi:poly(3-hydroxyalkanoate) synthetase
MSPEMYTILGVGIGLLAVIVALFAAAWQMMNSRFDAASSDTNARFEESNQRYLLMAEQNRQLIAGVSQMSQRVARLEGLLRLPHETDGHGEG